MKRLLLICATVISGCASVSSAPEVPTVCPTLAPIPEDLKTPVPVDFRSRMEDFLLESQPALTPSPSGSTAAPPASS